MERGEVIEVLKKLKIEFNINNYYYEELKNKYGKVIDLLIQDGYLEVINLKDKDVLTFTQKAYELIISNSYFAYFNFKILNKDEVKEKIIYTYKFNQNEFYELVIINDLPFFIDYKNKYIFAVVDNNIPIKFNIAFNNIFKIPNSYKDEELRFSYEEFYDNFLDLAKKCVYFFNSADYHFFISDIISTYFRESLKIAPYLRFLEPFASGKTVACNFINKFAYRSVLASLATTASLPRLSHFHNCTLILDEFEPSPREEFEKEDLMKLVRAMHVRGSFFVKAKEGKPEEVVPLEVFGHVVIASKNPHAEDIESRCLRLKLGTPPKGWKSKIFELKDEGL